MKKLYLITFISFLYANNLNFNKQHISELLKYEVKLPNKIYNPFLSTELNSTKSDINSSKNLSINLLAILNKQALFEIGESRKWLRIGESFDNYKFNKLISSNSVELLHKDKKVILTFRKIDIKIKVSKQ